MHLFSKITLSYLCGALLCFSSIQVAADEEVAKTETSEVVSTPEAVNTTEAVNTPEVVQETSESSQAQEFISSPAPEMYAPAGRRSLLPCEIVAIKERLAAEETVSDANSTEVEATPSEVEAVPADVREEAKQETTQEESTIIPVVTENPASEAEQILENPVEAIRNAHKFVTSRGAYYVTTHPGAYHQPILVTSFGEVVHLEDGSVWKVSPYDASKTINWMNTDVIVVTQNHHWFSVYGYSLMNQTTGVSVEATISAFIVPAFHTVYNHRIIGLDDLRQMIWLEDGSVWSVHSSDYSTKWQLNDTIIIGINTSWYMTSRPNILINADILQHVRAICIQN